LEGLLIVWVEYRLVIE